MSDEKNNPIAPRAPGILLGRGSDKALDALCQILKLRMSSAGRSGFPEVVPPPAEPPSCNDVPPPLVLAPIYCVQSASFLSSSPALLEFSPGRAVLFYSNLPYSDDGEIFVNPWRWTLDGKASQGTPPLLAYRTWDGAWRVLDARVSALLPAVDAQLEDE